MSIKGYPSQTKDLAQLDGYSDAQSQTRSEFITAQENYSKKVGLDTNALGFFRLHATAKSAEANTTNLKRVIKCTAHGAQKGDVVRFESSAANPYFEAIVSNVPDANTIILGTTLNNNIATGDQFFILRVSTQRFNSDGSPLVTLGAIQYNLDGVLTEVSQDTVTPANSKPLPVTSATNSAGALSQQTLTGTTASTINPPANAVSCNIQAPSTNTQNIRVSIGSVASATAGMLFEPGRSEIFNGAAAISACAAVAGTNEVIIQWVLRS